MTKNFLIVFHLEDHQAVQRGEDHQTVQQEEDHQASLEDHQAPLKNSSWQ